MDPLVQDRYPLHEQLLFVLARTQMGERAVARARLLMTRRPDWEAFWETARRHSVTPLIASSLGRLDEAGCAPPPVTDRFVRAYRHNALRHALRAETLARILNALHAAGIPTLVLKGTALAHGVYPDPALRVCSDVDLLVRPDDLPSARSILSDTDRRFVMELAADHHDFWVNLPGKWSVSRLHWSAFWDRAMPTEVVGAPALVLASTDLLLSLCASVVRHRFTPFKLLVDVAETLRRYGDAISWDALRSEAQRSRLDRFSWHVFGLTRRLLDAPVPPDLLAPPVDLALTWLEARLFAYHQDHALSPLQLHSLLILLEKLNTLLNGGPLHRARALREWLFPPRRRLARAYGYASDDSMVYSCYLRRLLDLLRRYGPPAVALLTYRPRAVLSQGEVPFSD